MEPTRRELLYGAAGLTGARLLPATTQEAEVLSGLVTGKPKALPYAELPGFLSKSQLEWHHNSHYGGALAKFVQLDAAVSSDPRSLVTKANSVVLHELYFDNMAEASDGPRGALEDALTERFGSVDRWAADFSAAAKGSRGWTVLARHPLNGRLYNIASDSHTDGPLWLGVPLVVLDMYEHSYYIDFQNQKAEYVSGFVDHLDWAEVDRRFRA